MHRSHFADRVRAFLLAAALVFTPIWVLGGRYAVSAVHDVQAKLPRVDSVLRRGAAAARTATR